MFNNTVKQMKAGILPCSLGHFINSFIISFFWFVLKNTLLPALVCFLPACCLSCPKYVHLPLIIRPSRGAFHYTNIVSSHLFLLFLPQTGAARRKQLWISRKQHPLLKLCCTAILPQRRNLKNLTTSDKISNEPKLSQKNEKMDAT